MTESRIVFPTERKTQLVSEGENLLVAVRSANINLSAICCGQGLCGKCRVVVVGGSENLGPVSDVEAMSLSDRELEKGYRLACLATVVKDGMVTVNLPLESRVEQQRLLVAGIAAAVSIDPSVRTYRLLLTDSAIGNVRSDVECLFQALVRQGISLPLTITHDAMTLLPLAIRNGDWTITVALRADSEVIWVEPGDRAGRVCGLALDVGTTKLAAYLLDLNDGKILATASALNPQMSFGEDVISRISYASRDDKNLKQLQELLLAAINRLLRQACEKAGVDPCQVYDVAVAGNTAMHHIFLGITPRFVALSPFPPVVRSSVRVRCKDLCLETNLGADVYLLPNVAGFVGADAVADVLATELYKSKESAAVIDIGTNTEIIITDGRRLISCSCASGPAFEGMHIQHGMRAEFGAIERVYIDPKNLEPGYKTIGDAKTKGLCGSGIVDAIASMFKCGIIGRDGIINLHLDTPRIRANNGLPEYVIAWAKNTGVGDITVTQHDIEEIQLAKAAIYAGVSILTRQLEIQVQEIKKVFLAGAFGTYVDPENALWIGMYPEVALDQRQVCRKRSRFWGPDGVVIKEGKRNQRSDWRKILNMSSLQRIVISKMNLLRQCIFPTGIPVSFRISSSCSESESCDFPTANS